MAFMAKPTTNVSFSFLEYGAQSSSCKRIGLADFGASCRHQGVRTIEFVSVSFYPLCMSSFLCQFFADSGFGLRSPRLRTNRSGILVIKK
jgi:hypothetical protein